MIEYGGRRGGGMSDVDGRPLRIGSRIDGEMPEQDNLPRSGSPYDAVYPATIRFENERGVLVVIRADGQIVRGPAFTTTDAASLEFWHAVERAFPGFLRGEH